MTVGVHLDVLREEGYRLPDMDGSPSSSGWAETSARALHARSERLRRRSLELRAPEWTLVKRCLRRGVRLARPDDSTAFCARRRARY
jgi:hypothetical protein